MRPYVCDQDNVVRTDERTFRGRRKERVSVATLRKRYRHLRTFFNWSVKHGLIDASPLEEINPPSEEKSVPDFLTPDQLESLLQTIDADHKEKKNAAGVTPQVQWLKDTILLAVCTGMRRGELANLQWSHVDLGTGFITVRNSEDFRTKSGNERRIPIAGDATGVLTRLQSEHNNSRHDHVLTKEDGSRISPDYASERFKYYVRKAKLPDHLKFHSLRDTCASWLVQNGVPLAVVQKVLGHSNQSTTEKYAHLTPEVMQRAMRDTFDG